MLGDKFGSDIISPRKSNGRKLTENAHKTLAQWLNHLETLHPKNIELGLQRIQEVADRLKLGDRIKENQSLITTVAGTNGKGSCVATLETLFLNTGESVGGFTSPHFLKYNERIRVNGKDASDKSIIEAFELIEQAREETPLTYFEFGALAAVLVFVEAKVKHILLEVGLGGRLDAVNIFDADVAVLTSIDLDHQEWLGDSREKIGFEKAGIFRTNKPAIVVDSNIPASVLVHGKTVSADLVLKKENLDWQTNADSWSWLGQDLDNKPLAINNLPIPLLPLPSVAAALQAFLLLGGQIDFEILAKSLSTLSLCGRFQRGVVDGNNIVLDVAHNPAAASHLAKKLNILSAKKVIAVFAVMKDKDYLAIMETLSAEVNEWMLCALPKVERSATEHELINGLERLGLEGKAFATVQEGYLAAVKRTTKDDLILVLGSFHTVAEVLSDKTFAVG